MWRFLLSCHIVFRQPTRRLPYSPASFWSTSVPVNRISTIIRYRYSANNITNISNDILGDNNYKFRPIPAIIRFTSERVLVFIRFMRLCNDREFSSFVVLVITTIKRRGWRMGGQLRINWISSRGQPTRGGPPAWGLGEVLTTPPC